MTRPRAPTWTAIAGAGAGAGAGLGQDRVERRRHRRVVQVRRGRAGQVEAVAGDARLVEVDQRQRGRRGGRAGHADGDALGLERAAEQAPEPVVGQPAEERGRRAQPGQAPRGVVGAAAQPRVDPAFGADDQVD
jgi:hypothetical protein